MSSGRSQRSSGTACGLLALLCWASSVAGARTLSESMGPLAAACAVYGITGAAVLVYYACRRDELRILLAIPKRYLLACGGLFVLYEVVYYGAIGLSHSAEQAIEVSVLNYLWPALTLLFSIPILKIAVKPPIVLGVFLAVAGVFLVQIDLRTFSTVALMENLATNPWPYALGLAAGVSWALYSALSRRWAPYMAVNPVPLYLLLCGITFGAFGIPATLQVQWTTRVVMELAYMTIVVSFLGYWLWNQGMQKGNVVLIISASYLTPLASTLIAWAYFHAQLRPSVWLGSALVVIGSVICKLSASEPDEPAAAASPPLTDKAGACGCNPPQQVK